MYACMHVCMCVECAVPAGAQRRGLTVFRWSVHADSSVRASCLTPGLHGPVSEGIAGTVCFRRFQKNSGGGGRGRQSGYTASHQPCSACQLTSSRNIIQILKQANSATASSQTFSNRSVQVTSNACYAVTSGKPEDWIANERRRTLQ